MKTIKFLRPETVQRRIMKATYDLETTVSIAKLEYHRSIKKAQDRCNHQWKFHSDPSGNNDSFYDCTICGKTRK